MCPVLDEPIVLTDPLTGIDEAAPAPEELVKLLEESKGAMTCVTLCTTSETFTPTAGVFILGSVPNDPWFEEPLDEEALEPWHRLKKWHALPEQVEAHTLGTKPTLTTNTAIRKLLRGYREGEVSPFEQPVDLETLAAEQGVQPVSDLSQLRGDFWPENDDVDEFIAEVCRWRTAESERKDLS